MNIKDEEIDVANKEMISMSLELVFDQIECWKAIEKQDRSRPSISEVEEATKQHARRQYVRSVFAYIEGMCFAMKHYAILFDKRLQARAACQPLFSEDEIKKMLEVERYLDFKENIKLTFKQYARLNNHGYTVDFANDVAWNTIMLSAYEKRGKLMHPKTKSDLQISDAEIDTSRAAFEWFSKHYVGATNSHVENIRKYGYF